MVKSPLVSDWYDSIFSNYETMAKSTTFSAPFLRSSLPPDTKILCPGIYFRVNKTDIENQYALYSRTCSYVSYIIVGVNFTVSYAPVGGIFISYNHHCHCICRRINYFLLDISNAFQNISIPNPEEMLYLSLPHLYLEWFKIKWSKHPLASRNKNEIWIQAIKSIQGTKPSVKLWFDLLKEILVIVKIIRSSSYHAVFPWFYMNYKYFLVVETYYISWQHRIWFSLKD